MPSYPERTFPFIVSVADIRRIQDFSDQARELNLQAVRSMIEELLGPSDHSSDTRKYQAEISRIASHDFLEIIDQALELGLQNLDELLERTYDDQASLLRDTELNGLR